MTPRTPFLLSSAALAAALAAAAGAGGVERFWQAPLPGGDFNDPANWSDGIDLGIPGALDTAIFDLPGLSTVGFPVAQSTDRVVIRSGAVTFDLATPYTLLNPLPTTPAIVIGEAGPDSARLTLAGGALMGEFTRIGLGAGAFGWLVVSGAGASLLNETQLSVGEQGAGLLEIDGGAEVFNGPAVVGAGIGALGDVLVSGTPTIWSSDGTLVVGKNGTGGLTIQDAAIVTSGPAIIAQNETSFADVVVRGRGSYWQIDGSLDVGMTGPGTLTIQECAHVETSGFATVGTWPLAPFGDFGGIGDVRVSGAGSSWVVGGDLSIGYLSAGRWTLGSGGYVSVGGNLFRGEWLNGVPLPQTVLELGTHSDYTMAAIQVAGATDGFEVHVQLIDGFVPLEGDVFEIVSAQSGAALFTFVLPELPKPLQWQVLGDGMSRRLVVATEPGPVPGDIDGDGVAGITDLLILLAAWGKCPGPPDPCPADLSGDGSVGIDDLLILLAVWT